MFEVETLRGALASMMLRDTEAASSFEIVPERGGIVSRFQVGSRDVLYLDDATLADRSKNVRGGIPVLFPIAGRLEGDTYRARGRTYALKQHGFARNSAWAVESTATDHDARVSLALRSTPATLDAFPWPFELYFTFVLAGASLTIEQVYRNLGDEPMPLHAGFHPYFSVPDAAKRSTRIATRATRAFDNTKQAEVPFGGFDLTQPEVDLHLLDHDSREIVLQSGAGGAVRIEADPSFTTWVVWTLAGKDYVCVEPWTAPGNALNRGTGLIMVPPRDLHRASVKITAE